MAQDNSPRTISMPYPHHVEEKIRRRAYELFENRGGEDGHDLEDWLAAEQEITAGKLRIAA